MVGCPSRWCAEGCQGVQAGGVLEGCQGAQAGGVLEGCQGVHAIGFGIPPACLVARGTGTRSPELLGDSQAPGGHFSEASLLGMPKLLGRPPCSWLWHPSSMLGRQRYRYKVARAPGGFPSSWRTLFGGRSAGDAKAPLELDWRPNHPVSPYSSLYWCPAAGSGPFW